MISSMTGYGKGSASKDDLTIETEIKSVNSRYLDLSLRLPKFLLSKEFEVREKIKSRIRRGKVYVSVAVRKGEFEERFNEVDPAGIKFVVNLLSEIKKSAKIRQSLALSDLLLFQNMLFKDDSEQASEEFTLVLQSIDAAIDELNKMRDAEGSELPTTDLAAFSDLKELQLLYLTFSSVNDISALTNLTNLRQIELSENKISDINPFINSKEMVTLRMTDNNITDISVLEYLEKLTDIRLSRNKIEDIGPLVKNQGIGEGVIIELIGNPLNEKSLNEYIPQLVARGAIIYR